jgi:hypothetical protein
MTGQIEHLIEMAGRPNVTLQILTSQGAHIGMAGSFVLLSFPGPIASYVVYLEHMTGELFIENEVDTWNYSIAFDHLAELALGPEESVDLAAQIAQELR